MYTRKCHQEVFGIIAVLLISSTSSRILVKEPTFSEVGGCSPEHLRRRNSFTVIFVEFCQNFEQNHRIIKDCKNTFWQNSFWWLLLYKYIFVKGKYNQFWRQVSLRKLITVIEMCTSVCDKDLKGKEKVF